MAGFRSPSLKDSTTDHAQPNEIEEVEPRPSLGSSEGHPRSRSPESLNEDSPFIPPEGSEAGENHFRNETPAAVSDPHQEGQEKSKSVLYLILLTLSIGG